MEGPRKETDRLKKGKKKKKLEGTDKHKKSGMGI